VVVMVRVAAGRTEYHSITDLLDDVSRSRVLVYRTLVVPRHKVDEEPAVEAKSNVLAHFLDQGYVATQILAIRRLLDTRNDVFSLRRLLDDIGKHRLLITQEILRRQRRAAL
jgi:hypothetical protein